MNDDKIYRGGMQNFRFSAITPNEKVYDMVQLMIQDSTRVNHPFFPARLL